MLAIPTIENVYSSFQMEPLQPDDPKFYKELYGDFLNSTKKRLTLSKNQNRKYLMIGHKGVGKSSFMNLLAADEELQKHFFVVRYSINEIGNPYDFTHLDFLLSLALKGTEIAQTQGIKINNDLLEEIKKMIGILNEEIKIEFDKTTESQLKAGGKLEIGIPKIPFISEWIKAKVYSALQLSEQTRENLRSIYKIKPHELLKSVNDFLVALKNNVNKDLLFLVDDTDKLSLKEAFDLFDLNREFLQKPLANVIYMLDMSVANSSRYAGITTIGESQFFPSLKLMPICKRNDPKRKGEEKKIVANKENLKKLIFNWCPQEYIDSRAINTIIEYSGGNTRQTLRLLWYALDYVVIEGENKKILEMDVDKAINRLYNEYTLNTSQIEILKSISKNPYWNPKAEEDIIKPNSPFLELIYNLGIFEYRNGLKKWRYPNPVLNSLLKR